LFSIDYDADADALYIRLADGTVARTHEIDTLTMVDEDAAGKPLGIEVIHPARPWPVTAILAAYELTDEDRLYLTQLFPTEGAVFNFAGSGHRVAAAGTRQLISA
jgi:uncharacterized protein YuzE